MSDTNPGDEMKKILIFIVIMLSGAALRAGNFSVSVSGGYTFLPGTVGEARGTPFETTRTPFDGGLMVNAAAGYEFIKDLSAGLGVEFFSAKKTV